jgi:hypothetical protein
MSYARFTIDEVVKLTLDFYRRNYIEGLFLSSGITTSIRLVDLARLISPGTRSCRSSFSVIAGPRRICWTACG